MADHFSDDFELVAHIREKTGAQDASAIRREDIESELEEVKETVAAEVRRSIDSGTISIYDTDAVASMAEHLLALRVADLRRRKERSPRGHVPAKEIPKGIGHLRRHDFEDRTLKQWRDEVVRNHNRLTE